MAKKYNGHLSRVSRQSSLAFVQGDNEVKLEAVRISPDIYLAADIFLRMMTDFTLWALATNLFKI